MKKQQQKKNQKKIKIKIKPDRRQLPCTFLFSVDFLFILVLCFVINIYIYLNLCVYIYCGGTYDTMGEKRWKRVFVCHTHLLVLCITFGTGTLCTVSLTVKEIETWDVCCLMMAEKDMPRKIVV